jgi:hypothetical protein
MMEDAIHLSAIPALRITFFAPVRSSHLPAVGAGEHTCAHPLLQSDLILTRLNSHPSHIFLFQ